MHAIKKAVSFVVLWSLLLWNIHISVASTDITPTSDEVKKVESEVVKLQWKMFEHGKTIFEKLSWEFQKLVKYEETWNTKMEIHFNEDMFWEINGKLNFNNFTVKSSNFDSEVSTDINLQWDYKTSYESGQIDLKTFASLINKDGNIYGLLKDLNFTVSDKNLSEVLSKAKETFKDNKYIKFPTDAQSQQVLTMLKNFNPKSVISQVDTTLQSPLFTTYKKEGNKYLLIPTKHACDTYFNLDKTLNFSNAWYTPKTCTETVYKAMVSEFMEAQFYLTLWEKENIFWIYLEEKEKFDFTITYDESSITKVDLVFTPDQKKYKDEWFSLNYSKNNFLKSKLYAEKWLYTIDFNSTLDANNHFVSIDARINMNKDLTWTFTLKDKKIKGFFQGKEQWYDYNLKKMKLKSLYVLQIGWLVNDSNNIWKLNVGFAGVDVKTKKVFLLWKFWYNTWKFTTYLKYNDTMGSFVVNWTWTIENKYFTYDSNFNFSEMYTWNFSMKFDFRENKNNCLIDLLVKNKQKDMLKFIIQNDSKRIYKDEVKIEAPKDFQDFKEVLKTIDNTNPNWFDEEILEEIE